MGLGTQDQRPEALAYVHGGWLPGSLYAGPRFDLLGIYPTLQGIGAQILTLAVLWAGFAWKCHQARPAGQNR